jgi:hypothetical protein
MPEGRATSRSSGRASSAPPGSVHGSGDRRRLAAEFVGYILQRAREEGGAVYEKAKEVVEEGKAVGSLKLADVRGTEVDVEGRKHVVSVIGGGAQFEEGRSGRTLLRITITAEVDGVKSDYTTTFGRYGKNNEVVGYVYIRVEKDAERFLALVEALRGAEGVPHEGRRDDDRVLRRASGGFMRFAELYGAITRWLKGTGR